MDASVNSAPGSDADVHDTPVEPVLTAAPLLEAPDLEGLEFLLDEIEDQIAPLA